MKAMTRSEWRAFLSAGSRTGKLATVRADGRPHVVPIWFLLVGDDLVFMTGSETVKGRNIVHRPHVSISVDDERPPFSFILIEGKASVCDVSPDELLDWSTRIARRYVGDADAESYGKRNAVPGELFIRVSMDKVVAVSGVADW